MTLSPIFYLNQAYRWLVLIALLLMMAHTWACVTPATGSADLRFVPGSNNTLTLIYGPFTTLGNAEDTYCASAFRLPTEFIDTVDRIEMVQTDSTNAVPGLLWSANPATTAAVQTLFNAESGSQWFGFSATVQREIPPDNDIDFRVRVLLKPGLASFDTLIEPMSQQGSNRVYVGQANDNGTLIDANADQLSRYGNAFLDTDSDSVSDSEDNCTQRANPDQQDNDNDGSGNACDRCPNDEFNQCDASIPTVSEWGLILFTLLLITVSVGFIRHYSGLFLATGFSETPRYPLWLPSLFFKALMITTILVVIGILLALSLALAPTSVDIMGLMITTPIVAYLLHLLMLPK